MKKFKVIISKHSPMRHEFIVWADTKNEATEDALLLSLDYDFAQLGTYYKVESAQEVKDKT